MIVKPGETPFALRLTIHLPGAGPVSSLGPRIISSTVIGRVPARFVNQLESGTSSMVLTLAARPTSG